MLSFPDIAILSGVALIVFGPERLPSIAHELGKTIGTLRKTAQSFMQEMELPPSDSRGIDAKDSSSSASR